MELEINFLLNRKILSFFERDISVCVMSVCGKVRKIRVELANLGFYLDDQFRGRCGNLTWGQKSNYRCIVNSIYRDFELHVGLLYLFLSRLVGLNSGLVNSTPSCRVGVGLYLAYCYL